MTHIPARHPPPGRRPADSRDRASLPAAIDLPAHVLALQRRVGNRSVVRMLGPRSLQRVQATVTGKKNVRLHTRKLVLGENVVQPDAATTVPKGAHVAINQDRTATDKAGRQYTWAVYGGRGGFVKTKYLTPIRQLDDDVFDVAFDEGESSDEPASKGPKAGFELEFNNVFVLPRTPAGPLSKALLDAASQPGATLGSIKPAVDALRDRGSEDETPFEKRTVIFKAPNQTWAATTDTTLHGVSNLEIVGIPLTPDQLDGTRVEADRRCLKTVFSALKSKHHPLVVRPRDLAPGLVDVDDDIVMINTSGSDPLEQDFHVQLTQATQLPAATGHEPTWWLRGLNYRAMPILKQLARVLTAVEYQNGNPKNLFGETLPKTSVATLLGATTETDRHRRRDWVKEMARALQVPLEEIVGRKLVAFSKDRQGELVPTGFTWKVFLTDLLNGEDRIAEWSRTAFKVAPGATPEDFGYGMIDDPDLPPDWYVHERRKLGSLIPRGMWSQQQDWAKETRKALKH